MGELSVRELPLFPLPEVVLFPQEVLPILNEAVAPYISLT